MARWLERWPAGRGVGTHAPRRKYNRHLLLKFLKRARHAHSDEGGRGNKVHGAVHDELGGEDGPHHKVTPLDRHADGRAENVEALEQEDRQHANVQVPLELERADGAAVTPVAPVAATELTPPRLPSGLGPELGLPWWWRWCWCCC